VGKEGTDPAPGNMGLAKHAIACRSDTKGNLKEMSSFLREKGIRGIDDSFG